jgi:hypothetical protein
LTTVARVKAWWPLYTLKNISVSEPELTALGLIPKYDDLLSDFAFNPNLRRYT